MLTHKLMTYSGADESSCINELEKYSNNFWMTLYTLTSTSESKENFVNNLAIAESLDEKLTAISELKDIYGGKKFGELKRSIYDNDESFFLSIDKPTGKEGLHMLSTSEREIVLYTNLLKSKENSLVIAVLSLLYYVSIKAFNDTIIDLINDLMRSKDIQISDKAIGVVCDSRRKLNLFKDSIIYNLGAKRELNHFSAIRVLWLEENTILAVAAPFIESLTKSSNSQVRSMANKTLVKYNLKTEAEVTHQVAVQRQLEVEQITSFVSRMGDSKALHYFADKFNWDDDLEYLRRVINHKSCKIATAKLIFWRSEPIYFQQFDAINEVKEYNKELFALQSEIKDGISKGTYNSSKVIYDPTNDYGLDRTLNKLNPQAIKNVLDYPFKSSERK
ncbi:MAG: DUF4274 domain-containing protein [Crocinitomix sp.]|nr:DUF4274 domain-containing protein [Crocinitomix sp.]